MYYIYGNCQIIIKVTREEFFKYIDNLEKHGMEIDSKKYEMLETYFIKNTPDTIRVGFTSNTEIDNRIITSGR